MCFSATASFTAGTVLAAVGGVTLSRVRDRREVPYALIPMLFAVQQLIEGGLWLTFADEGPTHLNASLTHIYQFFSHVLWPVYVPIAVRLLETVPWRRRTLLALAVGGAAAGLYLLYFLLVDPTVSRVVGGHIDYISPHFYAPEVLTLYVLATCASGLVSSNRTVRWFGLAASLSLVAATMLYRTWFISVWCFFAAIISVVILAHFFSADRPRARA